MNKQTLQKINNLAKFIFEESEYHKFMKLIVDNEFKARLFLDNYLEGLELELRITDNEDILSQYKKCHELIDIVMNDIINKIDNAYGEGKQIKQVIR